MCNLQNNYVDLQVNGYGGVDFSSPKLSMAQIEAVTAKLLAKGTALYCPTVITSAMETYEKVLPLLGSAVRDNKVQKKMAGLHLEGPFINPAKGAVGAHNKDLTCKVDVDKFEKLWNLSGHTIKILTLAPELDGAEELISAAVEKGICVSVGHTLCKAKDIGMAVNCGASLSTHLGNGCPNLLDRHDNPVWAQLDSPLKLMLIADGEHLPVNLLRIFLKLRSADDIILTSDSAAVAGLPAGSYTLASSKVKVLDSGRIENFDGKNLGGSGAVLADCVKFMHDNELASDEEIKKFAHKNPLAVLGVKTCV